MLITPKEKAKELAYKYYNFVGGWTSTNKPSEPPSAQYEGENMRKGRAIQCALIHVDGTISELQSLYLQIYSKTVDVEATHIFSRRIQYYKEVKSVLQRSSDLAKKNMD